MHALPTTTAAPVVRGAGPGDLDARVALLERCSDGTVRRRFHGAAPRPIRRELDRIAHPTDEHRSWVALAGGDVRGTATLAWGRDGAVEAAFLVEDAWFRRGVGRALFAALAAEARRAGVTAVVATVQSDNERAARFLRAMAPGAGHTLSGPELAVTIPVGHPARRAPATGHGVQVTEAA
jgi:GNAT superfamily N-acetyltransferase